MDIMLDAENNKLVWENGDLKLVDGLNLVKQHILTALYTLKGDWLLDDRKGLNNIKDEIFFINSVKNQILGVDGVNQIKSFAWSKDRNFVIKIYAKVISNVGEIEINEDIQL